jgi:DNA-binding ferritin-like protein
LTAIAPTHVNYTVPGMKTDQADEVVALLQDRLHALNDLALTLKHVHWNVVGPNFIAVHTMLDPQVDGVRAMVDAAAERIATLGGSPVGTPGALALSEAGTTTRSAATTRLPTSPRSTSSTTASSQATAKRSRRPRGSTRSPRTC